MPLCIGCGRREAPKHRYCGLCRERMEHGWQTLDYDDLPTIKEGQRAKVPGKTWPLVEFYDYTER